ncbi:MAG TPA: putative quinol monooxygenase [Blastocatellia bacterium]|nr:putative quinol monooxygenase [Blastocatellia bacterium]
MTRREFVEGAIGGIGLTLGGRRNVERFGMFGRVVAQPGQRDTLVQHLLKAAELVGNAPGCELYVVYTSLAEPDVVWVTEAWRSKADHDASLSLPGVRELIGKARPLIASVGEPIITTPVGGKGL